jgi:hypothetical protein
MLLKACAALASATAALSTSTCADPSPPDLEGSGERWR